LNLKSHIATLFWLKTIKLRNHNIFLWRLNHFSSYNMLAMTFQFRTPICNSSFQSKEYIHYTCIYECEWFSNYVHFLFDWSSSMKITFYRFNVLVMISRRALSCRASSCTSHFITHIDMLLLLHKSTSICDNDELCISYFHSETEPCG